MWKFFDFLYANGTNPVEDWYQYGLTEGAQYFFDKILKECVKTENHLHWAGLKFINGNKYKKYRIWELGFRSDGRQYRLLGIFNPGKQATLLVGCYHKGKVYTPSDALDSACKRARMLSQGEGYRNERTIRMDR